jgi:2-oxoisovalerate dehydrogenase E1 component beta subunit
MRVLKKAVDLAEEKGISCELIDLQTINPWDEETVMNSVMKTGRLVISHEVSLHMSELFFSNKCFYRLL